MTKLNEIEDYIDRAETCRRWARVISNTLEIARLYALADEYDEWARRLRSTERAPHGARRAHVLDTAAAG